MSNQLFTDLHCHPTLKPYARSIKNNNCNSNKPCKRYSIWHRRRANILRRILNKAITITRFTQTDFKTLATSGNTVICASLAPLEKGFFMPKIGEGIITDVLTSWITGIGKKKIDFIQGNRNYFSELVNEYNFLLQQNNIAPRGHYKKWKYKLVKSYSDIGQNQQEARTISVILSIEGAHAFWEDNSTPPVEADIINNIDTMLQWEYKPLFIAPAHHFYNYICGHAYSLSELIRKQISQDEGVNTGITTLGETVIRKLLDHKIYIDIKHMSRLSRREFYGIHQEAAYCNIPIVISHASVNGYSTVYSDDPCDEENGKFFGEDINIFDDEIVKIAQSGGLFGLQLDERRIASKSELRKIIWKLFPWSKLKCRAGYLWNQIYHIAEVLDSSGLPAFDIVCIGSDYDGIVDPLDGYWTAKQYSRLKKYLGKVIDKDINDLHSKLQQESNKMNTSEIINKLFSGNMMEFLKNNL